MDCDYLPERGREWNVTMYLSAPSANVRNKCSDALALFLSLYASMVLIGENLSYCSLITAVTLTVISHYSVRRVYSTGTY